MEHYLQLVSEAQKIFTHNQSKQATIANTSIIFCGSVNIY